MNEMIFSCSEINSLAIKMAKADKIAYLTQMIDHALRQIHDQKLCAELIRADIWSWQKQIEDLRHEKR